MAIPGALRTFWKTYPLDKFSDAAIAGELLTILHEGIPLRGVTKLKILRE
jgi:hypothetical protein